MRGFDGARVRRWGARVRGCRGATVLVFAMCASAMSYAQAPAFDVASIKPNTSGENRIGFGFSTGGLTATNMPLRALVIQAYKLNEYELLNLPDWAANERFDVAAKTTVSQASGDERLLMLRTLLADRFKLRMHQEQREMAMYSLVFARDDKRLGPNNTPSTVDCVARSRVPQPPPSLPAPPAGQPPPLECGVSMGLVPTEIVLNAGGMAFTDLVRLLARNLGRRLTDGGGAGAARMAAGIGTRASPCAGSG